MGSSKRLSRLPRAALIGAGLLSWILACDSRAQTHLDSLETNPANALAQDPDEIAAIAAVIEEVGAAPARRRTDGRLIQLDLTHALSSRLDTGRGFGAVDSQSARYLGSPIRALIDMKAAVGSHLTLRMAAEKDPGETLFRSASGVPQPDFTTFTLNVSGVGILTTAVVGDFAVHWGWGLLLGRPSFGMGAGPRTPRSSGIAPYRGFAEHGFFRGAAASFRLSSVLSVTAFASRRETAARPDTTTPGAATLRLVADDGLHRTVSERAVLDNLMLRTAGAAATISHRHLRLGIGGYALSLSDYVERGPRPDQHFTLRGRRQWGWSVVGSVRTRHVRATVEGAAVDGHLSGFAFGSVLPADRSWTFWTYFRRLRLSRQSLLASAPTRGSGQPAGEGGITFGCRYTLQKLARLQASVDLYWFDWLRFGQQMPTEGRDLSISLQSASLPAEIHIRVTMKEAMQAMPSVTEGGVTVRAPKRSRAWRTSARLRIAADRTTGLEIRFSSTRIRASRRMPDAGSLLALDLHSKPRAWLEVRVRHALFDSDSGNSRTFTYEPGLTHDFTIPSFSGNGRRTFIVLMTRPLENVTIRLKYAVTVWPAVTSVGSGLEETDGDRIRSVGGEISLSL